MAASAGYRGFGVRAGRRNGRTPMGLARIAGCGLALALAGCVTDRGDVTGSIAATGPNTQAEQRAAASTWGERYRADPNNKQAALNYAQALRQTTQYNQAVAVLENLAIKMPYDRDVLGAYGKSLADAGRFKEAADVLSRAHTPENPNWSILSAQGSVEDQLGDHDKAQAYYDAALKIKPNDPHVLSNLGLSYALSNKLPLADQTLRQASAGPEADMRVRQNFALILALEGKFGEAEQVSQRDLSAADAQANVAAIRSMIAQSNTWRDIQRGSARKAAPKPVPVARATLPVPQQTAASQ